MDNSAQIDYSGLSIDERVSRHSECSGNRRSVPAIMNPWGLSKMEAAVMDRLVSGLGTHGTADKLCLAYPTVGKYLERIRKKMSLDPTNLITTTRACILWDRYSRDTVPPQKFKILVEYDGDIITSKIVA